MPRPGPRRPLVAIRLSDEGRDHIDKLAAERGANRSEMIRVMLAYASQHMPANWQPRKERA
ncbi:MAG TPA: CopG family transcriptional regulator [Pseudonocardiaceae bacterium]|nr:CopG family transcriptional regulator [Pseudonocardiaceae bacterium]